MGMQAIKKLQDSSNYISYEDLSDSDFSEFRDRLITAWHNASTQAKIDGQPPSWETFLNTFKIALGAKFK